MDDLPPDTASPVHWGKVGDVLACHGHLTGRLCRELVRAVILSPGWNALHIVHIGPLSKAVW
jgi:hypothetical protein